MPMLGKCKRVGGSEPVISWQPDNTQELAEIPRPEPEPAPKPRRKDVRGRFVRKVR